MEEKVTTRRSAVAMILLLIVSVCFLLAGCRDDLNSTDKTVATVSNNHPSQETPMPAPTKKSETISTEPPHIHSYSCEVIAPSCTADGYTTFSCACGDTYTADPTSAVGHSYKKKVTAATCTKGGYTTYTCSTCGHSYTGNKTKATGHNWGSWTIVKKPTNTAAGKEQCTCKDCGTTNSRSMEKVTYEHFAGAIGAYNAHNLAYTDWTGDTEQAAFIEVYTIESSGAILNALAVEFEKIYGFAPRLDDEYRCKTSCTEIGTYMVDGYAEPQTVYHYTITDKTYIYITNDMYKVYVQQCDDGSVWAGFCIYGTMDTLDAEQRKPEVQALYQELETTFEELIGLSYDEMLIRKEELQFRLSSISVAGTVRSIHSDKPVQVLYIYCRGFAYKDNNS